MNIFSRLQLSIPFLLTTLFALTGARLDSEQLFGIPRHLWHCGSEERSTQTALAMAAECPEAAELFNHCCAVHDDCYTNQFGKQKCDERFCRCTDAAAELGNPNCTKFSMTSCMAVQVFGGFAYTNSIRPNLPLPPLPIKERTIPSIEKIAREYAKLYEHCPFQNVTFASCALNHDLCLQKEENFPREKCALRLINCLEETKDGRKKDEKCDESIERLLNKLVNTTEAVDDSFSVEIAFIRVTTIAQKLYRKHVNLPNGTVVLFAVIVGLLFLLCCVACFASSLLSNRVVLEEKVVPTTTSEVESTTECSSNSK